jgi:beta-1,4-mannosyltransferase
MKNIYLYPFTDSVKDLSKNPYISDFCDCISNYYNVVNKNKYNSIGIFDIFKNLFKIDYVFFNWIEEIEFKKNGKIQFIFLIILIYLLKLKKIKVVWTIHNKQAHLKDEYIINKFLIKFLAKKSDFIITHSTEGIKYANTLAKKKLNIRFFYHPLKNKNLKKKSSTEIDILIWGTISRYKGIDLFLEKLYKYNVQLKYNIKIVGIINDKNYESKLRTFENNKIQILNKFISIDDLNSNIENSKIVLFTYSNESVLSSGAVMESLSFGANIVGPDIAVFKDLHQDGLINVYPSIDFFIENIEFYLFNSSSQDITNFIKANSWESFSNNIYNWIK